MSNNRVANEVSCSGDINSHHPLVYLYLKDGQNTRCPYCNKILIKKQKELKSQLNNSK